MERKEELALMAEFAIKLGQLVTEFKNRGLSVEDTVAILDVALTAEQLDLT